LAFAAMSGPLRKVVERAESRCDAAYREPVREFYAG
jgi:hypothetical protein